MSVGTQLSNRCVRILTNGLEREIDRANTKLTREECTVGLLLQWFEKNPEQIRRLAEYLYEANEPDITNRLLTYFDECSNVDLSVIPCCAKDFPA